jgi:hypothetical protein
VRVTTDTERSSFVCVGCFAFACPPFVLLASSRLCVRRRPPVNDCHSFSSLLRSSCTYGPRSASNAYVRRCIRRPALPFRSFAVAVLSVIVVSRARSAVSEVPTRVSVYLIVFVSAALSSALIHRCVPAVVASASRSVARRSVRLFFIAFSLVETVAGLARRRRSVLFPPLFLCLRLRVRNARGLRSCLRFDRIARRSLVGFICRSCLVRSRRYVLLFSPVFPLRNPSVVLFLRSPSGPCLIVFGLFGRLLFLCPHRLCRYIVLRAIARPVRLPRGCWCSPCLYERDAGQLCRYLLKKVSRSTCHSFSCSSAAV